MRTTLMFCFKLPRLAMDSLTEAGGAFRGDAPLLRLLQLASPAFPVGAYAYSQGLEWAVERGWVGNESEAGDWIVGLLAQGLARLEVPVTARLHQAWCATDLAAVHDWSRWLHACRESAELRAEDRQLGNAAALALTNLGLEEARPWSTLPYASFATLFMLAAARWHIPWRPAASGYLWAWAENQVAAAIKLVPLGQAAGQRMLARVIDAIPRALAAGADLADADIGYFAPGLALASARHETQYTRLFRS